jgi:hypothetical protein
MTNKSKPSEEMGEKTNQNPAAVTPYLRYTLTPLLYYYRKPEVCVFGLLDL